MGFSQSKTSLLNVTPEQQVFLYDVLEGLSQDQKRLPCKYFYDERGSRLFEQICELDEYYLTRTELAIMQRYAAEMASRIGPQATLVEFGSGSSVKTRLLLDHLHQPAAYVPIDISREHLYNSAQRLNLAYPQLNVRPLCVDFTTDFELPADLAHSNRITVYFPGSTIGNFEPQQAGRLIQNIAHLCGDGGGFLIGIDLQKDSQTLNAAYDDLEGVTAEFNLNLLHRINRELDADFDVDRFGHVAFYNADAGRMEIYLESLADQTVYIADQTFEFSEGERIHTEFSHKYTVDGFSRFAAVGGFELRQAWTDDDNLFAVLYFVVGSASCQS